MEWKPYVGMGSPLRTQTRRQLASCWDFPPRIFLLTCSFVDGAVLLSTHFFNLLLVKTPAALVVHKLVVTQALRKTKTGHDVTERNGTQRNAGDARRKQTPLRTHEKKVMEMNKKEEKEKETKEKKNKEK